MKILCFEISYIGFDWLFNETKLEWQHLALENQKVKAIISLRQIKDLGLKEALKIVEDYMINNGIETKRISPNY